MNDIYEGKEAIVKKGAHRFRIGESIKLLSTDDINEDGEKIIWYNFKNKEGSHQILLESEFEWVE